MSALLSVSLAGVGNGIAQFWWTRSLSLAPPSAVVPFNYLSLVWAMILGFLPFAIPVGTGSVGGEQTFPEALIDYDSDGSQRCNRRVYPTANRQSSVSVYAEHPLTTLSTGQIVPPPVRLAFCGTCTFPATVIL